MSRYRSARAVLAGAAVIALAGCGSAAGTSSAASSNSPAGAASSPAGAVSATAAATPTASSGSFVAAGSIPFPVAVGNTWVYDVVTNINEYETANVTVQGDGTQSVSVPAGTYRATLVNMTMVTKVGSFTTTAVVKVWTAPGTGPVKTEQLIRAAGKTQFITTSALVSFTKQAAGS